MIDLMVDLETMALTHNAAILSIGAVTFNTNVPKAFHMKVDYKCYDHFPVTEFKVDRDTLNWWATQPETTRKLAFEGDTHIVEVLEHFAHYTETLGGPVRIWSKGGDFDIPILENAYQVCGVKVPWHYRNKMCARTLGNLFPSIPWPKPVIAHDALEDAKAQASHIEELLGFIYENINVSPGIARSESGGPTSPQIV